jgi:FtsZ-binding cell division protein ZapB
MTKKGKAKNTVNKAKHSKLLKRKNDKIKQKKLAHKTRLKALNDRIKEVREKESTN